MSRHPMSAVPKAEYHSGPGSPTTPGVYWFRSEPSSLERLVEVCLTEGELTVWWHNKTRPVTKLKGHWRGPIAPMSYL